MNTIRETNLECQELLNELAAARTLSLMIVIAWQIARTIAVNLVEEVLRAQAATEWNNCPQCGKRLQSKGMASREIKSMIGLIKWKLFLAR